MRIHFSLFVMLTVFVSCVSHQFPIQRETAIVEKPEVDLQKDGTGIIRTPHCDVSVRYIDKASWKMVASSPPFTQNRTFGSSCPPYEIFFVTIQNSTKKIIKDIRFSIQAAGYSDNSLTIEELLTEGTSPVYQNIRISNIFSLRRLFTQEFIFNDIEFEKNSVGYPFPFILPQERGSLFIAFRIPPFEHRRYTLSVEYLAGNDKKVVDFEIARKENRLD